MDDNIEQPGARKSNQIETEMIEDRFVFVIGTRRKRRKLIKTNLD